MSSSYLLTEETIISMTKALKPLSDEWLSSPLGRRVAYAKVDIAEVTIKRFDRRAHEREMLRRKIMGECRKADVA